MRSDTRLSTLNCGVNIKRIHKVIYTKLSLEYGNVFDYEFNNFRLTF